MATVEGKEKSFFHLLSGKKFYPFRPSPSDIFIYDIAASLSNLCRYNGNIPCFYSVAEHSFHCSYLVPEEHALTALLHDATEAFVGDMITPIKKWFPEFVAMEDNIWEKAISPRFGLPKKLPPVVKRADLTMLATEVRDLIPGGIDTFRTWGIDADPTDTISIRSPSREPYSPTQASFAFLERFYELYTDRDSKGRPCPKSMVHLVDQVTRGVNGDIPRSLENQGIPSSDYDYVLGQIQV